MAVLLGTAREHSAAGGKKQLPQLDVQKAQQVRDAMQMPGEHAEWCSTTRSAQAHTGQLTEQTHSARPKSSFSLCWTDPQAAPDSPPMLSTAREDFRQFDKSLYTSPGRKRPAKYSQPPAALSDPNRSLHCRTNTHGSTQEPSTSSAAERNGKQKDNADVDTHIATKPTPRHLQSTLCLCDSPVGSASSDSLLNEDVFIVRTAANLNRKPAPRRRRSGASQITFGGAEGVHSSVPVSAKQSKRHTALRYNASISLKRNADQPTPRSTYTDMHAPVEVLRSTT